MNLSNQNCACPGFSEKDPFLWYGCGVAGWLPGRLHSKQKFQVPQGHCQYLVRSGIVLRTSATPKMPCSSLATSLSRSHDSWERMEDREGKK